MGDRQGFFRGSPRGRRGPGGLWGIDFDLQGSGGWGWSTGIPPGGHLGRQRIDAEDSLLPDGSDRVFSGTVAGEVAKVVLTLSNNKRLAFHPRRPRPKLLHDVVWLRNFKYFVEYYPPNGFVTEAATFNRAGELLHRGSNFGF